MKTIYNVILDTNNSSEEIGNFTSKVAAKKTAVRVAKKRFNEFARTENATVNVYVNGNDIIFNSKMMTGYES